MKKIWYQTSKIKNEVNSLSSPIKYDDFSTLFENGAFNKLKEKIEEKEIQSRNKTNQKVQKNHEQFVKESAQICEQTVFPFFHHPQGGMMAGKTQC